MNLSDFSRVHESNLEKGKRYLLKTRFGQGVVELLESSLDGYTVEIKDGGFSPPMQKPYRVGDVMTVGNDKGSWYEGK